MAVIRPRKDETPSGDFPAGDAGSSTPGAPDRTRSALKSKNTAASRAAERPATPRGPMARQNATAQQAGPTDAKSLIADTRAELNRVVWPSTEEVRAGTIVTVGLLIFFSLYIFVLDQAADWVFHALGLYTRTNGAG